ncbi:unnamed protein product [Hyaloperonospora brassicae]|uniref:Ricin B lectin domain-containing protein n=1 Tax=Hyaloperonospora brassicae TaxID=162125 RepID=A0AAV0UF08_HYABA|nr:unnamed protein product [Hyaloperonospora brassicae]
MDLSEIPFDVPVILQSTCWLKNLQSPLGYKKARCPTDNRDSYEHVVLHRIRDDKVAIQSGYNGRFLQVSTSGECVFDPTEPDAWELFTMETNSECSLYFVSCHTGTVLQCDQNGTVQCANSTRKSSKAWRIVEPHSTNSVVAQMQHALSPCHTLANKERRNFVLELAKCGKTPDEIEQIVTRLFDGPAAAAQGSTVAVPVTKE